MKTVVFVRPDVAELAAGFVCVDLVAGKHKELMAKLEIKGAPSYAVLAPDGTKLETYTGTTEHEQILALLQKPLRKVEEELQGELAKAQELAKAGKWVEAYRAYLALAGKHAWSAASKEARQEKEKIEKDPKVWPEVESKLQEEDASGALAAAEKLAEEKKWAEALAAFEKAAKDYPKAPSGAKARERAAALKKDPEVVKAIRAAEQEKKAKQLWGMAETYLKNRLRAQGRAKLEQIIAECPDTEYAQKARDRLAQLDKRR